MSILLPHEIEAIEFVNNVSKQNEIINTEYIKKLLKDNLLENVEINKLVNNIFQYSYVTINFHPDRISNNDELIIDGILKHGIYNSQFKTGTTNGSKTAYIGGERDLWEKDLFGGFYHKQENNFTRRVKYGALNIMNYKDGASPRFGSCYFKLNKNILKRCTFTYGDSYLKPEYVATKDSFIYILRGMLDDIIQKGRFFNNNFNIQEAIKYLLELNENNLSIEFAQSGRALDEYIETQIHGEINLMEDVDYFVVDESFKDSAIVQSIHTMSEKYNVKIEWISQRKVYVNDIPDEFRGPVIKPFAKKILDELKIPSEYINAATIGIASRYLEKNPSKWSEFGDRKQTFQYLKQLWHVLVQFG